MYLIKSSTAGKGKHSVFPVVEILTELCWFFSQLAPTGSASLLNSMMFIQNPVEVCNQVFALIENLTSQIKKRLEDPKSAGEHQNWKGSGAD